MVRGGPHSEGFGFGLPEGKTTPEEPQPQSPLSEPERKYNFFSKIIDLLKQILSKLSPTERVMFYDVTDSIGSATDASGAVSTAHGAMRDDENGYIRERVFDRIGKNAARLNAYNGGPGTWYVRVSYEGQQFSDEIAILEGVKKTFENVYELRHRSDTLGLQYIVTELDIWPQTAVSTAEKIEIVSTDKDTNFTGAIVMNDHATENITGLASNRYMIRGVNIQSMQPLIYRLIFWSSSTFEDTDLDVDTYIDDVILDMTASPAFRINNANQYYLNVGGLEIIYEDFDITRTLHISLQDMSAAAKLAGAAGAVQLDIKMSPRL